MKKKHPGSSSKQRNVKRPSRPASKPSSVKRPSRPASRPSSAKRPSRSRPSKSVRTPRRPASKPRPAAKRPRPTPKQSRPIPKKPRPAPKKAKPIPKKARPGGPKISAAERAEQKTRRRTQRRSYSAGAVATGAGAMAAGAAVGAAAAAGMSREERLNALSDQLASLQEAAALVDIYSDLEDTDQALVDLPAELEAIRVRGYVFANFLERKIEVLTEQWNAKREEVVEAIDRRSQELGREIDQAERAMDAAYSGSSAQIGRAENAISQLESKVAAAQDTIEGMFKTIDENVTQVMRQMEHIDWVLDQAVAASFDFYEGEDFVSACRAQLIEMGQEGPKGILHLTDERLIFEQKEEVATKKILFITTQKELVQEMLFEELVGHVEESKTTDEGLLGRKEILQILFIPDARHNEVTLRLHGADNQAWAQLIERVRSGEIDRDRLRAEGEPTPEEQTMELEAEEIPTDCPNCGATFTQPIVRGMREITCEYCSTIVRI